MILFIYLELSHLGPKSKIISFSLFVPRPASVILITLYCIALQLANIMKFLLTEYSNKIFYAFTTQ